jgi:hypothetical protein
MLTIQVTSIDTAFNNVIKDFIYKEKHKWKKDLKNVKALTSGYRPSYKFFDDLYEFSYNFLKKLTKREWQKSCWWANYYTESNYCDPHHHKPETLSAILIVKSSSQNPLYFMENDKKYDVPEKDGMMLFFNSEYFHGVKECKEERITCTLDFIPKRRKQ